MKKLNFWGLIALAIQIIKLWKENREEIQMIFLELKEVIQSRKKGTVSDVVVEIKKIVGSERELKCKRVRVS